MVGYFLVAIAIGLGTVILVYGAYGYSINTKTGDIVQNGLLFVDSKPGGADIYLNNEKVNATTSARLVLPSGKYDLALKRSGYRDWQRKFTLDEHAVGRYVYPFLFPNKPVATTIKTYNVPPPIITQSPDRHWILVQNPTSDSKTISFDQYDSSDLSKPSQVVSIPAGLLTGVSSGVGTLTEVEWSTDNNHLLLQHNYPGGNEFIIFNRDSPDKSVNVNKLLNVTPTKIALRNKKIDQLYIYNQAGGTLQIADTTKGTLDVPFLRHVLAFKSYGINLINYVTDNNVSSGQAQARIWNNGRTYPLSTFTSGSTYILDTAEFQGHIYFIAGSNTSDRINLYKDPLSTLQDPQIAKAIPVNALDLKGAGSASFSTNTRFIQVQGGQNFAVYDLETQGRYQYTLQSALTGPMHWMDGHRLIGSLDGNIFVMDYDSTNKQSLVPTASATGGFFTQDYNQMLTTAPVANSSSVVVEKVDMRAGSDLPKQ
jgi:hypothetical protein